MNFEGEAHPRVSIFLDSIGSGEQTGVEVRISSKGGMLRSALATTFCQPMVVVAMLKLGYYSDRPLRTPPNRTARLARRLLAQEEYKHYSEFREEIYAQLDHELREIEAQYGELDPYDINQHLRSDVIIAQGTTYKRLTGELEDADKSSTESALLRAINKALGPSGRLAFPLSAPRLVELAGGDAVAVSSIRELAEFIEVHQASAIGISGPRGSGKTTLLGAISSRMRDSPSVRLSVPVVHNREDFMRRLAIEVLSALRLELEPDYEERIPLSRAFVGVVSVGLVLAFLAVSSLLRRYQLDLGLQPDWVPTNLVGSISVGSVAVLILTAATIFRRRENRLFVGEAPEVLGRIKLLQEHLEVDVEQTMSAKATAKAWSILELGGERNRKARRRAYTLHDLVVEVRQILEEAIDETTSERFLVCIDELDKVSNSEDAIATINSLKDLFHIRGVHFLLTVSDEALSTFSQRSILPRDAFDSSFDLILPVAAFSSTESVDLILSRATGFPPALALFCHAWSGGLPREVLRTARRCIELQRLEENSLTLPELVNRLVIRDAISLIDTTLRSMDDCDEKKRTDLEALRLSMNSAHLKMSQSLQIGASLPDAKDIEDVVVAAIARRCQIALLLVSLAENFSARSTWWTMSDSEIIDQSNCLAEAVRGIGLAGVLRDAPFEVAINSLSASLGIRMI